MHISPAPLSHNSFYILLALSRVDTIHGYGLKHLISDISLRAIDIPNSTLYSQLILLAEDGLISATAETNGGKNRTQYKLTSSGIIALKADLKRQHHAVKIGQAQGLLKNNEPPLDIQRLLLDLN